uniref:Uncharacterized protein LOC110195738 isoform X2 n=1 Tax=Phascolarctos cinereus TaxID=38626 RepID=A0A6P5IQ97_PHACI|nr:uncharacterized protein LOC110195738 isoform X2 [Phascolarctos cinereus]
MDADESSLPGQRSFKSFPGTGWGWESSSDPDPVGGLGGRELEPEWGCWAGAVCEGGEAPTTGRKKPPRGVAPRVGHGTRRLPAPHLGDAKPAPLESKGEKSRPSPEAPREPNTLRWGEGSPLLLPLPRSWSWSSAGGGEAVYLRWRRRRQEVGSEDPRDHLCWD